MDTRNASLYCGGFPTTVLLLIVAFIGMGWGNRTWGQMITTTVPMQLGNDSFYENSGFGWGLRGPNWSVQVPGQASGPGFYWNQGSHRSAAMVAPSLTTTDGYPGAIFSGTVRPFVMGFNPVVGGAPWVDSSAVMSAAQIPQQADMQASARSLATAQAIVAKEVARNHDLATQAYQRGLVAEQRGNLKMARANYRQAFAHASPPLKATVYRKLVAHGWDK